MKVLKNSFVILLLIFGGIAASGEGCERVNVVFDDVVCGDGEIGYREACDDGNTVSGDGCSEACEIEESDSPCSPALHTCPDGAQVELTQPLCAADCSEHCVEVTCPDPTSVVDNDGDGCDDTCEEDPSDELCDCLMGPVQESDGQPCDEACDGVCYIEPGETCPVVGNIAYASDQGCGVCDGGGADGDCPDGLFVCESGQIVSRTGPECSFECEQGCAFFEDARQLECPEGTSIIEVDSDCVLCSEAPPVCDMSEKECPNGTVISAHVPSCFVDCREHCVNETIETCSFYAVDLDKDGCLDCSVQEDECSATGGNWVQVSCQQEIICGSIAPGDRPGCGGADTFCQCPINEEFIQGYGCRPDLDCY